MEALSLATIAVISCLAALFSAAAAWRSASSAKRTANSSHNIVIAQLARDTEAIAARVIGDCELANHLAERLKRDHKELAIRTGRSGDSRERREIAEVQAVLHEIQVKMSLVEKIQREHNVSDETTAEELIQLISDHEKQLVQIATVREKLLQQADYVERELRLMEATGVPEPEPSEDGGS